MGRLVNRKCVPLNRREREEIVPTILIAVDGSEASEAASKLGLEIAKAIGDEVVFIAVWAMIRSEFGVPYAYLEDTVVDAEKNRADEVLAASNARAATLGIQAETILIEGSAAHEICKAAKERETRMIVIGSHGWGALRGFIYGSVVAEVRRSAPCPVLSGAPASRDLLDPDEKIGG
jgi:nucleotide-binding universal stress UspA family protein